jgi:hypothetical protein
MSPQDLFGVTIASTAIIMVATGVAWTIAGAIGPLSMIAVGLVLLVIARPLARLVYRWQ